MIEAIGYISTALAIAGVLCNNRKMAVCFKIWLLSNALSLGIHFHAGIYSLAVRDLIFLILAVEGIYRWRANNG